MRKIRINQMGYTPHSRKQFIYIGEEKEFSVLNVESNQVVFSGRISKSRLDEASNDMVSTGDFDSVTAPGEYYIKILGETSYIFTIASNQPMICTDALLKGLYYQRCGVELAEESAGPWKHVKCHLQPSYVFCQNAEVLLKVAPKMLEQLDTTGGWHDAGDYGRYSVATAKTVTDMMLAYEHYRSTFEHPIGILESNEKGSDILHEVKIGLNFLLKMQKTDGSVYTKVASRCFPGMIMPEEDTKPLYVFDISSPATADFAAVMAMAARIYHEAEPVYAKICLRAAHKSYQWLKSNPEPKLFKNPENVISGEYGDDSDLDERYFAAIQMYLTTKKMEYHEDFIEYYDKLKNRLGLSWRDVSGYGTAAYLLYIQSETNHAELDLESYEKLKKEWLEHAVLLADRSKLDGYGITLALNEYHWGSTMTLLGQAMHLIIANQLLGKPVYEDVIRNNWDYIFGRNPMDVSYVTGLGANAIKSPHHRPSAADGVEAPVPGLLSGGPNKSLQDEAAREACENNPPAKCFLDDTESFSTNEIDTYWNSVAIYVGAYLCNS